jgi:hypothetical protein
MENKKFYQIVDTLWLVKKEFEENNKPLTLENLIRGTINYLAKTDITRDEIEKAILLKLEL